MNRVSRAVTTSLSLLVALSTPLAGQGLFGVAVGVGDGEVIILKQRAGRGPAAVYVYRIVRGSWEVIDQLPPTGADETGEGYSASLALGPGSLWVGSGDAGLRWAAHPFAKQADSWIAEDRIPLDPDRPPSPPPAALDLAGVMRILRPPARAVVLDGNRALVGVTDGREASVRVFEAGSGGRSWSVVTSLTASDVTAEEQWGAALALQGDAALVSAPKHDDSGAVFVFTRNAATGDWARTATLHAADPGPASSFGVAVAFDGETVLVGAPGSESVTGAVSWFGRDETTGAWVERGRVESPAGPGDGFGTALEIFGDELWVGAPFGADGRGEIYRYRRAGPLAAWRSDADGPVTGPPSDSGSGFGLSIALGEGIAVAGAPFVDGGIGRAAVFTRPPGGAWGEPVWLAPGGDLTAVTGGEVPCAEGRAGQFECFNVDLVAFLPIRALGGAAGETVSDVWGWADPETGREYALVGLTGGASVVDITDPATPVYLGTVQANRSGVRDLKVYSDHLFFTGDGAGEHGLVVFDLTRLRGVTQPPVAFQPDTVYDGIASAHNLAIDTETGFAYVVGANGGGETCGGGLHMVDIRVPESPTFAGCFTDTEGLIWQGRTHDAQCVVYRGPDQAYQGRQICFASNETALRIVDVTEKDNPVPIARATYPRIAYVHQGWLTDDHRYFYTNDELDELTDRSDRTRTLVWNVVDLDDPVLVGELFGSTRATDHNLYIKGNRMYQANYNAGMQVWDISEPENPFEIGSFDTTPWEGDPPGFQGAWTAYPFFESGTVVVSSIAEGLFVLRPRVILP